MVFALSKRSFRGNLLMSLLIVVLLLVCVRSFAAEAGSGAYWPGFRNYMAGVVPSKPGLYLRNDVLIYSATTPRVPLDGLPIDNAGVNAFLDIIEPEYVLPHKLWGANHAIVVTQAFAWARLSGTLQGTPIRVSGTGFSPADTIVSPLFLGWHKKNLYYNTNVAVWIPTGNFEVNRVVNVSRNFWSVDFEFGATHFDPKVGWDLSGVLGYTVNTENPATHYTSGNVLHFDFAIGKVLKNYLKPGLAGYAWTQVTPDTGSGALFGSFKSQVFGIGPIIEAPISKSADLTLRYYHEFGGVKPHRGRSDRAFA